VDKSVARIYSRVAFHAKPPFVSFFRLVHLRVTCFFRVFR
jgi:hypothetical protein